MAADATIPAAVLGRLRARLAARAGLQPPDWVLVSRLRERMLAVSAASAESYVDLVSAPRGAEELSLLIEAVRVGETRFFRHRQQIAALVDLVVPTVRARRGGPVRAWSAGCASGEEAYTVAMVLDRHLPRPQWTVSVRATDVSADAVEFARRARYEAATLQHVPDGWLDGFVTEDDGTVRVSDNIRSLVEVARHNLADEPYPTELDLVWCRNVLIYFTAEARRRVLVRLIESLRPGGHLFVGYSESVRDIDGVEAVRAGDAVVYRRLEVSGPGASASLTAMRSRSVTPAFGVAARKTPPLGVVARPPGPTQTPALGTPAPAVAAAAAASATSMATVRVTLSGAYDDDDRIAALAGELTTALRDHRPLVVELDGAAVLGDDVAPLLRRVMSAARAAGTRVELVAQRPGTLRWLRRHRLDDGEAP